MATAPVSCCLISRSDSHLQKTLESIAPFVEQICVVHTTVEPWPVLKPGVHLSQTLDVNCNDSEGRIVDFSKARNVCFELATQPWVMWLDSDDLITGAENLAKLCEAPLNTCYLFPYEYAYDGLGRVVTRQYRERLCPRGSMQWMYPIHEVMVAKAPMNFVMSDDVTVKHQRQYNPKPSEPGRNLRIIKAWMEKNPDDVRNMYYAALEHSNAGDNETAKVWLNKYLERSGWADERVMACLKLVDIHERERKYHDALRVAFQGLQTCDWFESYYAIGRQFYHLKNWTRCVHYLQLALTRGPTITPLFVNAQDRDEIFVYLNYALNQLGDQKGAYEAVLSGLKGNPEHPHLKHNKTEYEKFLKIEPKAIKLPPLDHEHLNIVFVTQSIERWDPESIKTTGIGGSETMLANIASRLAKLGHKVTVYADPTKEGTYEGAEWKDRRHFHDVGCDVLVVSRFASFLSEDRNVSARLRMLWSHDVAVQGASQLLLARADRVLALSAWHKANLCRAHNLHEEKVIVTRNGIDLERFALRPERNPYRLVNSSSPDRSWPVLLECFAKIREREPRAELHLFYGFDNWKKAAARDQLQMDLIHRLEKAVTTQEGVHYHGRVSQDVLAQEFLKSSVWAYPTWFTETSCISAMEAKAAGLRGVTSDIAALSETGLGFYRIKGEWTDAQYQSDFVDGCIEAMNYTGLRERQVEQYSLDSLALEWQAMFIKLIEWKKTRPLTPYQPTRPYQSPGDAVSSMDPPAKTVDDVKLLLPATEHPKATGDSTQVKLNLACGPNIFPFDGWVNYDKADFTGYFEYLKRAPSDGMPKHQKALTKYVQAKPMWWVPVVRQDCTARLTYADSSVDFIYAGQFVEHLNRRTQVVPFLKECHRMLRPGGVLRLTTPDLDMLLSVHQNGVLGEDFGADQPAWFAESDGDDQLSYILFGASGPDCTQTTYEGHFHCYSVVTMRIVLDEAGFKEITFSPSDRPEVRDEGLSHSLCCEATK